jgi:predicted MFS family arabinose efflux permease
MYNPIVFIVSFMTLLSCLYGFGRYAYGAFLPDIRTALGLNYLELGSLSTMATLTYVAMTMVISVAAVHLNTRLLLAIAGGLCATGLLLIAEAQSFLTIAMGVCAAGLGAAIAPAIYVEIIALSLQPTWQNTAVSAINAGATPGIVLTGLLGLWLGDAWRSVWLLFALAAVIATLWNVAYFPSIRASRLRESYPRVRPATFFNRASLLLAVLTAAYGYHLGFYYTFAVDYAVEEFGLSLDSSKAFWMLVGICGLPAIFTGTAIRLFGLRRQLIVSFFAYSVSGLALLVPFLDGYAAYASAMLFGLASIATGCGLMVLSSHLYASRPSLGFGVFYVAQASTLILSPFVGGLLAEAVSRSAALVVSVVIVLSVLPVALWSLPPRSTGRSVVDRAGDPT